MADTDADTNMKKLAPPYTSFRTIKTVIGTFKEHGLPDQVDRSVLSNHSGSVQGQILPALRFLNLIGHNDNTPRASLKQLVEAHGTDAWQSALTEVLGAAYAPIFEMKLETASPSQFNEKFKATYTSVDGDTLRKCITFFLNAVREAGIPISSYIMKNKKPRTGPRNGARKLKDTTSKNKGIGEKTDDQAKCNDGKNAGRKPSEWLLSFLEPDEMGEPEKQAIWILMQYFVAKGQ